MSSTSTSTTMRIKRSVHTSSSTLSSFASQIIWFSTPNKRWLSCLATLMIQFSYIQKLDKRLILTFNVKSTRFRLASIKMANSTSWLTELIGKEESSWWRLTKMISAEAECLRTSSISSFFSRVSFRFQELRSTSLKRRIILQALLTTTTLVIPRYPTTELS